MAYQRIPIEGLTEQDYKARAVLVTDLAEQVQDRNPALVWHYLAAVKPEELRRLAMIALAVVPTQGQPEEIWAWVADLPVAKAASA